MDIQSILCAVDFSHESPRLLRTALRLADQQKAKLAVLHVLDPLLVQAARIKFEAGVLRKSADEDLRALTADAIARTGIKAGAVAWRVRVGEPDGEILAEAKEQGADLLVMGTYGFSGMRRLFFGSTAARVLARTSIPVLTLPPEAHQSAQAPIESLLPVTRLLVAVDFSESSMAAVREAFTLARRWGLALTLLHAIPAGPRLERWREFLDADHEQRIQHARHELQQLAKEFSGERLAVTVVAEGGSPEEVIARIASEQRGTLVVMGLGQRNLLTPSPGSVAYRVLCVTSAPVLVVPTPVASSRLAANARADAGL